MPPGGEQFTDFNYWREKPLDIADFTDSEEEDDDDDTEPASVHSEDEGSEVGEDLEASYLTQESVDDAANMEDSILESVEGDGEEYAQDDNEDEDEASDEGDEEDDEEEEGNSGITPTREMEHLADGIENLKLTRGTPTPQASPRR